MGSKNGLGIKKLNVRDQRANLANKPTSQRANLANFTNHANLAAGPAYSHSSLSPSFSQQPGNGMVPRSMALEFSRFIPSA